MVSDREYDTRKGFRQKGTTTIAEGIVKILGTRTHYLITFDELRPRLPARGWEANTGWGGGITVPYGNKSTWAF